MAYAVVKPLDWKESRWYNKDKNIRGSKVPYIYHCGDDGGEVPPVPIPNTEVKLTCADNTLLVTARKDR